MLRDLINGSRMTNCLLPIAAFCSLYFSSAGYGQHASNQLGESDQQVAVKKVAIHGRAPIDAAALRPLASLRESLEQDPFKAPATDDVSKQILHLQQLTRIRSELATDYRTVQAIITQSQGEAATRMLQHADRINDQDYYVVAELGLAERISELPIGSAKQQEDTFQLVLRQLKVGIDQGVKVSEVRNATRTVSYLERHGDPVLALKACRQFGSLIREVDDGRFRTTLEAIDEVARRLMLVGKEFEASGVSSDGKPIEWSAYSGKVVLVNFWAAWSGTCLAEIPELKRLYRAYQPYDFEILGISLDQDEARLQATIAKEEIPWSNLFHPGTGFDHPLATKYGVSTIPTAFLVDSNGKVVSTRARGEELRRRLSELIEPELNRRQSEPTSIRDGNSQVTVEGKSKIRPVQ